LSINIVLVEPEIPQNTGNIIRSCVCTDSVLHLIKPLGFSLDEKSLKRAGLDYFDLANIKIYESFDEFLVNKNLEDMYFFTTKASKKYTDAEFGDSVFLIFGKETKGLEKRILELNPENNLRMPMLINDRVRSLNLSNTVAIALYEVIRQQNLDFLK